MLNLQNGSGSKTSTISVLVLDTPGPSSDLTIKDMTMESIVLSWEAPSNDGGSAITNYVVQKREALKKSWNNVYSQCSRTSWTIGNLDAGKMYSFRFVFLCSVNLKQ